MATAFIDQDDFYKMDASPKGICLIINNFEFERSPRLDTGPADKEILTRTFRKMDFEVRYFENCSSEEMIQQMENIQTEHHFNYNCFVCCISSHGNKKGVCGTDGHSVTLERLQSYIYSTRCPSLAGKPKVFFVDACRGNQGHRGHFIPRSATPVVGEVIADKRDFLLSFATTAGNVAYSDPDATKGAVYFYHLTRLLERYAKSKTIMQILCKLNGTLTAECPKRALQTAECFSTLAKELCFYWPVQAMLHLNLTSADQRHQSECARFAEQLIALQLKFADAQKRVQFLEQEVNRKDDQIKRKEAEIDSCRYDIHSKVEEMEQQEHMYDQLQRELQGEKARHQKTVKQLQDSKKACSALENDIASPPPFSEFSDKAFCFHDNHGKKVELSNDQHTAEYRGDFFGYGIVMSRDPMEISKLYEVTITKRGKEGWPLHVGVVTSSPDSLTLPCVAGGWRSAVVVYSGDFTDHGDKAKINIGKALQNIPVDSRVGLSLDSSRRLHLHVNGADQGVVPCRSLPDLCWALWQLSFVNREVKTLPVTHVP